MSRLILCTLLLAASVAMGRTLESGYSNDNGVIRVSVFMDLSKEKNVKFPEGTAMLRASRLLHKACPELPAKYNVVGRVLTNSHNRVEKTYSYVVEYDPVSVDAVIKQAAEDAAKVREVERLAAERTTAEKVSAEKVAEENSALNVKETNEVVVVVTDGSNAGSNIDHVDEHDADKVNGSINLQNSTTNLVVPSVDSCVRETKASITSMPMEVRANAVVVNATNAPVDMVDTKPEKTDSSTVHLKELTVKDIKDKMIKPKVTEKNGFKQVDVDSFGGIDPMEE